MLDAAKVGACVLGRYGSDGMQEAAKRFAYRRGDLPFPFFDGFLARGCLSKEQLVWIVDWKTAGRPEPVKNAQKNSEESVRQTTQQAFQTAPRDASGAVGILAVLSGVHVAVASAILAAWNPQEFGILDKWAWKALQDITKCDDVIGKKRGTLFQPQQYGRYIEVLRELKENTGMSCHDLDKALWVLGKAT